MASLSFKSQGVNPPLNPPPHTHAHAHAHIQSHTHTHTALTHPCVAAVHGKTYSGGLMHLVDWHATLAALGKTTLKPKVRPRVRPRVRVRT